MYAEERQQAIAQLVTETGRWSVNDLATRFEVTTETVRRDLSSLERLGVLRRVHGGAIAGDRLAAIDTALSDRDAAHAEEKERIAQAALSHLPKDEGVLLVDAGTTTSRFVAVLPSDLHLVAVTHAVPIASRLAAHPRVELHLLPGRVRLATQAAVGSETVAALDELRADVAVVGTNGITLDHGLSTPDHEEAAVKRALVRNARRVVLLADSSKFGVQSPVRFATLDQIDVVVTDAGLADEHRDALKRADVEVTIA
jgi:DeoR family transcriptional regulator, fructose operon transcriptional repressor